MRMFPAGVKAIICISLFITPAPLLFSQTIKFINGNWLDSDTGKFSKRTVYINNNRLLFKNPGKPDTTIDLEGKFVIPPFADVHTHNLSGMYGAEGMIEKYLREGIYYIQVLGGSDAGRKEVSSLVNNPASVDVNYANGGITCTLGHPFTIYEPLAMNIHNPAEKQKRSKEIRASRKAENDAYWFFDTKQDVDNKWPGLLKTKPGIIKIMLLDALNYEALFNDTSRLGGKGLSSEVAEYVVRKAHEANLKVYAHIETANDFLLGIKIGVDAFAHLPGYSWNSSKDSVKYFLTKGDIENITGKKPEVVTTAALSVNYCKQESEIDVITAYQRRIINLLLQHSFLITIGSDQYGSTLTPEVEYLLKHNLMKWETVFTIITEVNSRLIFPGRKIGKLEEGYEASFLVLENNPLKEYKNIKNIKLYYKQGRQLTFNN